MTKEFFSSLSLPQQCDLLRDEGKVVSTVKYFRFQATLFSIQSVFVEVLCYQGSTDIEKVEIANDDKLVKYLNRIDLDKLMGANAAS